MPTQIPLIGEEFNYSVSTILDDTEYIFNVRWNGRDESWYFDLSDSEGGIIRAGLKILLGAFPGRRSVDPRFPNGAFVVSDLSNEGVDATYYDLGTRVVMHYFTAAELLT